MSFKIEKNDESQPGSVNFQTSEEPPYAYVGIYPPSLIQLHIPLVNFSLLTREDAQATLKGMIEIFRPVSWSVPLCFFEEATLKAYEKVYDFGELPKKLSKH
jgi:hypothetical protein